MKIYSITQDDRYKTLVDADQSEGLQDFATQLAYGETTLVPEKQIFQVVYNSDDKKNQNFLIFLLSSGLSWLSQKKHMMR
ncbi:hypothetical protein NL64_23265 [Pseudomonas fluorescens]|jgi:hypothetical protein|nr:hypothetical protein NL64_23265 [Pseudomonas fluorescens]